MGWKSWKAVALGQSRKGLAFRKFCSCIFRKYCYHFAEFLQEPYMRAFHRGAGLTPSECFLRKNSASCDQSISQMALISSANPFPRHTWYVQVSFTNMFAGLTWGGPREIMREQCSQETSSTYNLAVISRRRA